MVERLSASKPVEVPNPAIHTRSRGETVTVGCKIPNGLRLQLCKPHNEREQGLNFVRDVTVWRKYGKQVIIKGNGHASNSPDAFKYGAALTHNVDAEFMDTWMEQNAEHPAVINHLVFIANREADALAMAREFKDQKSGLEPLKTDGDPRMPKAKNISGAKVSEIGLAEKD